MEFNKETPRHLPAKIFVISALPRQTPQKIEQILLTHATTRDLIFSAVDTTGAAMSWHWTMLRDEMESGMGLKTP